MARIRSVHPSLFTDEAWVSCSPLARILYIGLWTDADDQGLFEWKPLQLKMRLLPGDGADATALLNELADVDLVQSYEADGKRFGAIKDFRKFQRPQKPNAIHPIIEKIGEYVGLSPTPTNVVEDRSPTSTVIVPQMEDGGEDVGSKTDANASSVAGRATKPKARSYPEDFEAAWKAYPHHKGRSSKPKALEHWRQLPVDERASLVDAIQRFVPNVADTTGGKGAQDMATWLRDGKHLNWSAEAGSGGSNGPAPVSFDAPVVRASMVRAADEDFVRRYVDHYCRWVPDGRRLEAVTAPVAAALAKVLGAWAERNAVVIAVMSANDTPKPDLFEQGEAA